MRVLISDCRYKSFEPNLDFKRPDGTTYTWNKITILDERGNEQWFSAVPELVAGLEKEKGMEGKNVTLGGELRYYRGQAKFKIDSVEVLDK